MKKTIWQKIDRRIGRLKLFRNTVRIIKNTISTDIMTGRTSASTATLNIVCSEPEKVKDYLIDNTLVHAGDLSLTLNYLDLKKEAENQGLVWNENTGPFELGKDELEFAGVIYAIRSVIPQDWQKDKPGQYQVILKGIASEESGGEV